MHYLSHLLVDSELLVGRYLLLSKIDSQDKLYVAGESYKITLSYDYLHYITFFALKQENMRLAHLSYLLTR